jgi:hypothetical protein
MLFYFSFTPHYNTKKKKEHKRESLFAQTCHLTPENKSKK